MILLKILIPLLFIGWIWLLAWLAHKYPEYNMLNLDFDRKSLWFDIPLGVTIFLITFFLLVNGLLFLMGDLNA